MRKKRKSVVPTWVELVDRDFWGVELVARGGVVHLATSRGSESPALFYRRKAAAKHRDDLKAHGIASGRVVKVRSQIQLAV